MEETLQQLLAAGLEKCLASAEAESAASLGEMSGTPGPRGSP